MARGKRRWREDERQEPDAESETAGTPLSERLAEAMLAAERAGDQAAAAALHDALASLQMARLRAQSHRSGLPDGCAAADLLREVTEL